MEIRFRGAVTASSPQVKAEQERGERARIAVLGEDVAEPLLRNRRARDGAEAHITILTPAEGKVAVQKIATAEGLSRAQAEKALVERIRETAGEDFRSLGVGRSELGSKEAYYVAVAWPSAANARQALGFPTADFHITLGFGPEGDVHGVPKRDTSIRLARHVRAQAEEPRLVVHSDNIVETLNFAGACALHGEGTRFPMPWCAGRAAGFYEEYGGAGRRRFVVLPYGAKGVEVVDGVEAPVGPRPVVVTVEGEGDDAVVANMNDHRNAFPYEDDFDAAGAEKALKLLEPIVGAPLEIPTLNWDDVEFHTALGRGAWWRAGFALVGQAVPWVRFIRDFLSASERMFGFGLQGEDRGMQEAQAYTQAGYSPEAATEWMQYGCLLEDVPKVDMRGKTAAAWLERGLGADSTGLSSPELGRLARAFYTLQQAGLTPDDLAASGPIREALREGRIPAQNAVGFIRAQKAIGLDRVERRHGPMLAWLAADLNPRAAWWRRAEGRLGSRLEPVVRALARLAPGEPVHEAAAYVEALMDRGWGVPAGITHVEQLRQELGAADKNPRRRFAFHHTLQVVETALGDLLGWA